MKEIKKLIAFSATLVLIACSTEPHIDYADVAKRSKAYFEQDKKKDSKNFIFPDSVLKKPRIATYFEADAMANSIMFFTDTSKQQACVIRFFVDATILKDDLKQLNDHEYLSLTRPGGRYVITDSTVDYSYRPHLTLGYNFEHARTDLK